MKELKDKIDSIINEGMLGDMAHKCEADHEVQMARADLPWSCFVNPCAASFTWAA